MYKLQINIQSLNKINKILNKFFIKKKKFNVKKKKKIFTILKSPHVNKKAREHFIYNNFYCYNFILIFNNFFNLINFLIYLKKKYSNNTNFKFKIIKNKF